MNLRFGCFTVSKKAIEILIGNGLNLYISLRGTDVLTIRTLPLHEHEMFSHIFRSPLVSFTSVLLFSAYMSFTSSVKFILGYFLFVCLGWCCKWNHFLKFPFWIVSFLDCSLLNIVEIAIL